MTQLPAQPRRAVFLDRDGVLNAALVRDGKPYAPRTMEELVIAPGVPEGVARLRAAGFLLIGATNQPDVARGLLRREVVEAMNARLVGELGLDEIRVCWHDDADGCACRKPKPGLLLDAARERQIALAFSYMVGDRWRDVEAGQRGNCRTVWLRLGYDEHGPACPPDFLAERFEQAVDWIVADSTRQSGERR